ncbi:hypothetical protein [Streptomyces griseosporeus]|uniref:hypothetical protein n=1 Tax=Streptomyces griseosporeus TaxID=1910 RepID=UPI0036FD102A
MASDTASAAVPNPAVPPAGPAAADTTTPATGGLAGLLAPVQPARSAAFTLPPASDTQDHTSGEQAASGVNSTAFHDENTETDNGKQAGGKNGGQERSVVRAWLLAGAERWKKGGDARLKRLDIEKARAQAFKEARQIKETRTVNRAEKMAGGSTNSSTGSTTNAGKHNNSKTTSSGSGGVKNGSQQGGGRSGQGGSAGGSGSGGAGRGGTHGPTGASKTPAGGTAGSGGRGQAGTSFGGGQAGGQRSGKHDSPFKPSKARTDRTPGNGKTPSGTGGSSGSSGSSGSEGSGKAGPSGAPGKPGNDAPTRDDTAKTKDTAGKTPTPASGTTQDGSTPGKDTPASARDRSKVDLVKKPKPGPPAPANDSAKPANPAGKTDKTSTKTTPTQTPAPGPRINTLPSREAGYRDGTRAAKVASHVEAWRDGVRDGWTDTREAATAEKTRLDQAHADRKTHREKDQPVNATSADYQQVIPPKPDHAPTAGAQPIPVTGTDAHHIHLGDGAHRASLGRGEVRSLRSFQRRLNDKADRMTQIAEATRTLEQHAHEQAKNVTRLLEQAKAVKGGDKLIGALAKLEEAANLQAAKAAEIHQRAARAAEACKALHDNADTRYGAIYKAAQDSGDLAEMNYYREMAHA